MLLLKFRKIHGPGWGIEPIQRMIISQEEEQMTYVDDQYISVARKNEVQHHGYTMEKLRTKIAQLTKSVDWELEQHQSRLKELQQAENTLAMADSPTPTMSSQPTLEPIPSSHRRWTKSRKNIHRSTKKPVTQLVG